VNGEQFAYWRLLTNESEKLQLGNGKAYTPKCTFSQLCLQGMIQGDSRDFI